MLIFEFSVNVILFYQKNDYYEQKLLIWPQFPFKQLY